MSNVSLDILSLTVRQRLDLISELWDSISDAEFQDELTPEQKAELDAGIAELERDPAAGIPYEEFMEKVRTSKP